MWFWLAIISGSISTIKDILNRLILKEKGDSLAFAFLCQAFPVVFTLPFFIFGLKFPPAIFPYLLLIAIGVVDTLSIFLIMESFKYLEVSLRTIVYQLRLFWVLILSVIILKESLNLAKIMGIGLIFAGITLAVFKKRRVSWFQKIISRILGRKDRKAKGFFVTILASFLTAFEMIGVKHLLGHFSVSFVIFGALVVSSWFYFYWRLI